MSVKNLNLVSKTASVGNAKPTTPAVRIGSGLVAYDHPDTFLSLGQFPLPRLPEPDTRPRQEVSSVISMPPCPEPVGPTGSVSGVTACRRPERLARTELLGVPSARTVRPAGRSGEWLADTSRTNPEPDTTTVQNTTVGWCPEASRASYPGFPLFARRLGRDCQSPDRQADKRNQRPPLQLQQVGHRTAVPAQQAGK